MRRAAKSDYETRLKKGWELRRALGRKLTREERLERQREFHRRPEAKQRQRERRSTEAYRRLNRERVRAHRKKNWPRLLAEAKKRRDDPNVIERKWRMQCVEDRLNFHTMQDLLVEGIHVYPMNRLNWSTFVVEHKGVYRREVLSMRLPHWKGKAEAAD